MLSWSSHTGFSKFSTLHKNSKLSRKTVQIKSQIHDLGDIYCVFWLFGEGVEGARLHNQILIKLNNIENTLRTQKRGTILLSRDLLK